MHRPRASAALALCSLLVVLAGCPLLPFWDRTAARDQPSIVVKYTVVLNQDHVPPQLTVTRQPGSSSIAADEEAAFAVKFSPDSGGAKEAEVVIACNDPDCPSFSFNLPGIGVVLEPEIALEYFGTEIPNGGSKSFIDTFVGETRDLYFTIHNYGTKDLALTGSPLVGVSGDDASMFTVSYQPSSATVGSRDSLRFTITFEPTSLGDKAAEVQILNNDPDESDYRFTVTGRGRVDRPEMAVPYNGVEIPSGSTDPVNLGSIDLYNKIECILSIRNYGEQQLSLTGASPYVDILNGPGFSVYFIPYSTIGGHGGANFGIRCLVSSEGENTAAISIPNNDEDENPYTFVVSVTGTPAEPKIRLSCDSTDIPPGGTWDCGETEIGLFSDDSIETFNDGWLDLQLTGSPDAVAVSGPDAAAFTVVSQPYATVRARTSAFSSPSNAFTLRFRPQTAGVKTAEISIASNDPDAGDNPYVVTLTGTGATPSNPSVSGRVSLTSPLSGDRTCIVAMDTVYGRDPGTTAK